MKRAAGRPGRWALLSAAAALLATCALPRAAAQKYEFGAVVGQPRISDQPLGSVSPTDPKDDDSRLTGRELSFGVRLTINTPGYYGHEFGYMLNRSTFESKIPNEDGQRVLYSDKVKIQQFGYNFLMYMMPAGERWRPFLTGGIHMHQYAAPNVPDWAGGGSRKFGGNYGAGIKLFPHKNALFRLDIRHYISGAPYDLSFDNKSVTQGFRSAGLFKHLEFSAGFSIAF